MCGGRVPIIWSVLKLEFLQFQCVSNKCLTPPPCATLSTTLHEVPVLLLIISISPGRLESLPILESHSRKISYHLRNRLMYVSNCKTLFLITKQWKVHYSSCGGDTDIEQSHLEVWPMTTIYCMLRKTTICKRHLRLIYNFTLSF